MIRPEPTAIASRSFNPIAKSATSCRCASAGALRRPAPRADDKADHESFMSDVVYVSCRPCESRDPYAATSLWAHWLTAYATMNTGGYGSLLSQGRRGVCGDDNGGCLWECLPIGSARIPARFLSTPAKSPRC